MAFSPIAYTAPNYRDYKNYWVKPYEPGTSNPKPFALEADGGTQVAKLEINVDGFLISVGEALVIPYLEDIYDLWMFPSAAEADANNTTNALRIADSITGAGIGVDNVRSFTTSVKMKLESLDAGQIAMTSGYTTVGDGGAGTYAIEAAQSVDGLGDHTLANGTVAILTVKDLPTFEQYGATTADSVVNCQAAIDKWNGATFSTSITLEDDLWLKTGSSITSKTKDAIFVTTNNARIRAEKEGGFRNFEPTFAYWNEELPPTALIAGINVDVDINTRVLFLDDTTGFNVGDIIWVFNGYCDHYRILEQGTDSTLWNNDAVDLAGGQIMRVRQVNANDLFTEETCVFDYPVIPKLYGSIVDENARPQYTGFNTPRVERLVGSRDITLDGFTIDDSAGTLGTYSNLIDFEQLHFSTINNLTIFGGRGILLDYKCYRNNITNCNITAAVGNCLRFESWSSHNNVSDMNLSYKDSLDAALLLNLRPSYNNVNNISVAGEYTTNINTIGVYINGGYNNTINNVAVESVASAISIGFDCWDNTVTNVVCSTVGRVLLSFYVRRTMYKNLTMDKRLDNRDSGQEGVETLIFGSKDEILDGLVIRGSALRGIKIQSCERITIDNAVIQKTAGTGIFCIGTTNAELGLTVTNSIVETVGANAIFISHNDADDTAVQVNRIINNRSIKGLNCIELENIKYVEIKDNVLEATDVGINLKFASFYTISGNTIKGINATSAIDFEGLPSSQFLSSHGLVEDNSYTGFTTVFDNYSIPSRTKTGGRYGMRIRILTQFPDIQDFVYTNILPDQTSVSDWTQVAFL